MSEMMRDGKPAGSLPTLKELRERFVSEFACLPDQHKALKTPEQYDVSITDALERLRSKAAKDVRGRQSNV